MKHRSPLACSVLALGIGSATAQTSDLPPPATTDPAQIQQSNGVKFLSGGASEEDRNRLQAQAAEYPLRIELSGKGGEYVVADTLALFNRAGSPIASVAAAGPIVMFNLPPGHYTAEVSLPGGAHERRTITLGSAPQTLSWGVTAAK